MLTPDYPIHTQRLVLRPCDPATDVDAVLAYQSREDVCRYIPYSPRSREQVVERLTRNARDQARIVASGVVEGKALLLAVVRAADDVLVGDVMLAWTSEEHRSAEIGYVFDPAHHGNGYATEACRALLAQAFDGLRVHRVTARIDERNQPSAAVLRRLGMRQEAVLVDNEWFKGEWSTEVDFAILEDEWRARLQAGPATTAG